MLEIQRLAQLLDESRQVGTSSCAFGAANDIKAGEQGVREGRRTGRGVDVGTGALDQQFDHAGVRGDEGSDPMLPAANCTFCPRTAAMTWVADMP